MATGLFSLCEPPGAVHSRCGSSLTVHRRSLDIRSEPRSRRIRMLAESRDADVAIDVVCTLGGGGSAGHGATEDCALIIGSRCGFQWSFMYNTLLMASESAGLYQKTESLSPPRTVPPCVGVNIECNPSEAVLISFLLLSGTSGEGKKPVGLGLGLRKIPVMHGRVRDLQIPAAAHRVHP